MAGNTGGKVPKTPKARALGTALRQAREGKGFKLRQFAAMLDREPSMVSRWETGDRTPKLEDVARFLTTLGADRVQYDEIIALATGTDDPLWLAVTFVEQQRQLAALVEFEQTATHIYQVQPLLIPGLLQTSEYIKAIMTGAGVAAGDFAMRVTVRIGRRDVLTRTAGPVELVALVGEAALWHMVGSPATMTEQMRHLLKMTELPNVTLRVVPRMSGWNPSLEGAFMLIESEQTNPIVHIENRQSGLFVHEDPENGTYRRAIGMVSDLALSPDESAVVVAEYLTRWETVSE